MINFFDCGPLDGEEIQMFIDGCDYDYHVYAFEAYKPFADNVKERFKNNKQVDVYNYAIGTGKPSKLYLEPTGHGNSIYKTKNNVDPDKFIKVKSIVLSDWIKKNVKSFDTTLNILRFNIEGAELLLMNDIVETGTLFDIYLGSTPDIQKVAEIKAMYLQYTKLLKDNNINVKPFCATISSIDIRQEIYDKLHSK